VPDRAAEALARLVDAEIVQSDETSLLVSLAGASRRLPEVFAALQTAGSDIRETTITQPSLESLFIKLTGKELRE
jgi:ABC-2 type transport system ATP-binding protein